MSTYPPNYVVQEWIKHCSCCPDCNQVPCDGVMAGGICDMMECQCDEIVDDEWDANDEIASSEWYGPGGNGLQENANVLDNRTINLCANVNLDMDDTKDGPTM